MNRQYTNSSHLRLPVFFLFIVICFLSLLSPSFASAATTTGNQFNIGVTVAPVATPPPPPPPGGPPPAPPPAPPTIVTLTPANGATNIATTTNLQIEFSKSVIAGTGNIVIKKQSDASVFETISVGSAQVTFSGGPSVVIMLSSPLLSGTQYFVEIASTAIQDSTGNFFAGISGSATWSFTTVDLVPPVISLVTSTSTYTTGTVTFDTDELALATIEWGLSSAYGDGVASELGYTMSHSMTISDLATNTLYYFRLTANDVSGNTSAAYTGTFSTQNPPPPPDTTPPANPSNFTGNPGLTNILLSWINPTDPDFAAVRIMRQSGTYPTDQNDGVLVYDGTGTTFNDTGLATETRYYYTAFARDASLNYSSGALFTAMTDSGVTPPSPTPPTPTPPAPTPPGPPGTSTPPSPAPTPEFPPIVILPPITSTSTGPFVDFTATGTPDTQLAALTLNDFSFIQLGKIEERLQIKNGVIRTNGDLGIRVSVAANKIPKELMTIGIFIQDPRGAIPNVSYLLRANLSRTVYEGVVPAFGHEGAYPFTISILEHDRQAVTRLNGEFDAFILPKPPSFLPPAIQEAITDIMTVIDEPVQNISLVSAPVGMAVGASQAILIATNVTSGYDLYLLLLKLLGLLTGLFRRKRNEPWGVVYDSVTKRPLDPAYVIAKVRGGPQSKGEAITDLDGRYGFLLNPGEYEIVANKTHYKFPSDTLKGKARDELYDNLYFGNPFQVREGGVVQYNIPLDPVEFDWNEFAKNQDKVFMVYSKKQSIRLWVFNTIFFFGLVFSILSLLLSFTPLNIFVVLVYAAILGFQIFWRVSHKVTRVINKKTGFPIPFAIIKVWLSGLNTVVKKSVADETGQFYFLVPPGKYFMTVEEKLPDGSYKEVLRTEERELKTGVVKEDFLV